MAYGAYLSLGQTVWRQGDYSSTNKLTGTVHSDRAKTAVFNLTGYTVTIRIFKRWQNTDLFNKVATVSTPSSGVWSYAVAQGEMPQAGVYMVEAELSKAGEVMSTEPEEFFVEGGATA